MGAGSRTIKEEEQEEQHEEEQEDEDEEKEKEKARDKKRTRRSKEHSEEARGTHETRHAWKRLNMVRGRGVMARNQNTGIRDAGDRCGARRKRRRRQWPSHPLPAAELGPRPKQDNTDRRDASTPATTPVNAPRVGGAQPNRPTDRPTDLPATRRPTPHRLILGGASGSGHWGGWAGHPAELRPSQRAGRAQSLSLPNEQVFDKLDVCVEEGAAAAGTFWTAAVRRCKIVKSTCWASS